MAHYLCTRCRRFLTITDCEHGKTYFCNNCAHIFICVKGQGFRDLTNEEINSEGNILVMQLIQAEREEFACEKGLWG